MVKCKDIRKGIIQLEWQHKMMKMQIEDLSNKAKDIQMLRPTEDQKDVSLIRIPKHPIIGPGFSLAQTNTWIQKGKKKSQNNTFWIKCHITVNRSYTVYISEMTPYFVWIMNTPNIFGQTSIEDIKAGFGSIRCFPSRKLLPYSSTDDLLSQTRPFIFFLHVLKT